VLIIINKVFARFLERIYALGMMNVDINILGNIVNINVPAQISGLIGMSIILIAYQQKKDREVQEF